MPLTTGTQREQRRQTEASVGDVGTPLLTLLGYAGKMRTTRAVRGCIERGTNHSPRVKTPLTGHVSPWRPFKLFQLSFQGTMSDDYDFSYSDDSEHLSNEVRNSMFARRDDRGRAV